MQSASAVEHALERSEARYREIFERSPVGNYITAVDGTILACNSTFARLLGFNSREHAMSTNAGTLYRDPPDLRQTAALPAGWTARRADRRRPAAARSRNRARRRGRSRRPVTGAGGARAAGLHGPDG